jgi:gamma-glutamyltranspeptidase/glutathione hydrolase
MYLRRRAREINREAMSTAEVVKPGLESSHTSHFSIIDARGNAVSLTYTLNWEFGSGVVVAGAGFLLNNEMDDFSAKPGVPNAYGVIGNELNAIEPGKRMLSSMTPTIVLRDGRPALVLGAMGGSTIFTTIFQILLNVFDYNMNAETALAATRFHHQLPAATVIRHDGDAIVAMKVKEELQQMGYEVRAYPSGNIGEAQLIVVDESGAMQAAADPRGRGRGEVLTLTPSIATKSRLP